MSGPRCLVLAGLLACALAGCEDLLQEPDTGIATPLSVTVVSGDEQVAPAGSTLPAPLRARLVDLQGRSVDRLRIEWVVVAGGGSVSPRHSFTDDEGIAETTWTLGSGPGRQRVEARFGSDVAVFQAAAN